VTTKRPFLVEAVAAINLDRLAQMRPADLQGAYRSMFGRNVPAGNSEFARKKIAWQLQAEREGGLPESARQRALAIAKDGAARLQIRVRSRNVNSVHVTVTNIISDHDSRLPMPGSLIVKQYRGRNLVVHVLEKGFEYEGQRFSSLSALAKDITGTKWNGLAFFGLNSGGRNGR
jgi:Protein of unknown function (DUF2924)